MKFPVRRIGTPYPDGAHEPPWPEGFEYMAAVAPKVKLVDRR